jgi:hypothetical protein
MLELEGPRCQEEKCRYCYAERSGALYTPVACYPGVTRRVPVRKTKIPTSGNGGQKWGTRVSNDAVKVDAGEDARATQAYVPSDQPARYSSCSGVSLSILMAMDSSFSLATRLSSSSGTL